MKNISDIQQFEQYNNLEFIAKQVVEGFITGLHKSPFHGFSVEFAEHRIYNNGESTKHIDWKLYARTEKLFIKRYEEETNLRSYIIIDTSTSMLFPLNEKTIVNKLGFSVYCAAALIHLLRKQRDAVGLTLFSDEIELMTDARMSSVHVKRLYTELEKLIDNQADRKKNPSTQKQTQLAKNLHQIADNAHKRSLIIIFSDMLDNQNQEEFFSALQHLRYNKHEVVLFQVTDKRHEEQFDFKNRPYKFVDLESGAEMKINPNDIRSDYVALIGEYYNKIKLKCGQYNIDLIEADTNDDFNQVLLPYLIKRSKLF